MYSRPINRKVAEGTTVAGRLCVEQANVKGSEMCKTCGCQSGKKTKTKAKKTKTKAKRK